MACGHPDNKLSGLPEVIDAGSRLLPRKRHDGHRPPLQTSDGFAEFGGIRDGQAAGVIFAEVGRGFGGLGREIFDHGVT